MAHIAQNTALYLIIFRHYILYCLLTIVCIVLLVSI